MKAKKIEKNRELLGAITNLCIEANKIEILSEVHIAYIENLLYGNIVKNLLGTLLDESKSQELEEDFGISQKDILKIRLTPSLVAFTTDENPKGTLQEYEIFKKILGNAINLKVVDFINYFEEAVLLKDCETQIAELKKSMLTEEKLAEKIQGSIQVGSFDSSGNFKNMNDSKFNYFNKYSDEQLDDIYEKSPFNRETIDKVRAFRKRQQK